MVKIAPHFGHLIFASFAMPAHPRENATKVKRTNKMLNHFFIITHLLIKMAPDNSVPSGVYFQCISNLCNPFVISVIRDFRLFQKSHKKREEKGETIFPLNSFCFCLQTSPYY